MQKKDTKIDFSNQTIYVGIDVHLKQWKVTILGQYSTFRTFSQPPDADILIRFLHNQFPNAHYKCAYEAGYSGFGLYHNLCQSGIDCLVVNPADIPTKDNERKQKTDALDSRKIANCLRAASLESIYVPSWETIGMRNLIRTKARLISKRTSVKNRIKHFLYFNDIDIPIRFSGRKWGKDFISWLGQVKFQTQLSDICFQLYLDQLGEYDEYIHRCNKAINDLAAQDCVKKKINLLKTVSGIGIMSAMTILAEIDNIKRFKTLDKLASYVGLVPYMHSSGESERIGGMTIRGNKKLKTVLIESAWSAIRKDPAMLLTFNKLCERMTKNKAIVRIAKKLLNRIRRVLLTEEPYVMAMN